MMTNALESYNTSFVFCRELPAGNLNGDRSRGDDSKQYTYYTQLIVCIFVGVYSRDDSNIFS